MRKNKSVKDVSQSRSKPSQGREISIELQAMPGKQKQNLKMSSKEQSKQLTDRSMNWQHPSVSDNILRDIMNYRNISHSDLKSNKNSSTVAVYERHQDIMSQFAKINKKSFSGENNKKNQKLVLDHSMPSSYPTKSVEMLNQQKSITMIQSQFYGSDFTNQMQSNEPLFAVQKPENPLEQELQSQLQQLAAHLDELNIIEQSIARQYSDLVPQWQKMTDIEVNINRLQQKLGQFQANTKSLQVQLDQVNQQLLNASRELITSRKSWDQRGNGSRMKVLDEAIYTHEQFVKKITIRDFQDTLLFNMKVAIPDHQGKNSLKGIYLELFNSKCAKKFTMILKKHTSHMDLYDAKLLSDFAKKINDLDVQYSRFQNQATPHQDHDLLETLQQVVSRVEITKSQRQNNQNCKKQMISQLNQWQHFWKQCEEKVLKAIEQINKQVRCEYQKQTQKAADFKTLLLNKYTSKYRELKDVRQKKQKTIREVEKVRSKLVSLK